MSDTIELASTVLSVGISTQNLGRDLLSTVKGLGGQVATLGRSSGADYSRNFNAATRGATKAAESDQDRLKKAVESSSQSVKRARATEGDAARKVAIEEQKLSELRDSGKAKASQIMAAEDRIEKARRNLAIATDKATTEQREYTKAQEDLQRELDQSSAKTQSFGQKLKGVATGKVSVKGMFSKTPKEAEDAGEQTADRFSSSVGGGIKGATGKLGGLLKAGLVGAAAAAGIAIGSAFGDSITNASNLEQSIGGVEAVFKDKADQIAAASKTAATNLGMSRNSYNELATTLGAGLKNKGLKDFAGQTQTLIGLGSDLAAQFGGSTSDAVQAISSLMRGESDPIEKYGVAINETAINAELAARGQSKLTGAALETAKAQARVDILFRQTADAQGAFSRESDTFAGKQQRFNAQWEDFGTKVGGLVLPLLTDLMGGLGGVFGWLDPIIDGLGGIGKILFEGDFAGADLTFGLEEDSPVVDVLFTIREVLSKIGDFVKGAGKILFEGDFDGGLLGLEEDDPIVDLLFNIRDGVIGVGDAIGGFVSGLFMSKEELGLFGGSLTEAETVGANFRAGIEGIGDALKGWFDVIRPIAMQVYALLVEKWREMQPAVSDIFGSIQTIVSNVMKMIEQYVRIATGIVKGIWEAWGPGILQIIGGLWDAVVAIFKGAFKIIEGITDVFSGMLSGDTDQMMLGLKKIFEGGFDAIKGIFEGAVKILGGVWDGIRNTFAGPVNWVIDNVLNPLIKKINEVAGGFGLKLNIPQVPRVATAPSKAAGAARGGNLAMAGGGILPGYRPYRLGDDQLVAMRSGEGVAVSEAMRSPYERDRLLALNQAYLTGKTKEFYSQWGGLAGGGIVPNASQGFRNYDPSFLSAIRAWAALAGRMFYMTGNGGARSRADQERAYALYLSGRGPLAARPGTSAHESGRAMDINPWPNAREVALLSQFGLGLTVRGEPWHIGSLRGGSSGGASFDPLGMLKAAIGSIAKVSGAGYMGDILNAIPGKLIDGAASWISGKIASILPPSGGAPGANGGVQAIVRDAAAKRGWGVGAQWDALAWIIGRESGWRPTAQNPTSTAYGLFQFLNGTWAGTGIKKTSDPAMQAEAGMRYIASRYGTPVGAQAFWQRNHWYDDGGWLPTGSTLAMNGTGSPEAILTGPQWRIADKAIDMAAGESPLTAEELERILLRLAEVGIRTTITGADHITGVMAARLHQAIRAEV